MATANQIRDLIVQTTTGGVRPEKARSPVIEEGDPQA